MEHRLALAERTVPRYTSYPTAPHFSPAVGPERYAAWLERLAPDATVSLYLHVPFCTSLCLYCGCHTKAVRRRAPVEEYGALLVKEIDLIASIAGARRVTHVHWGGGTPSILGEAWLTRIAERIAAAFDLSAKAEHAIELDPRRMSKTLATALAAMGVNRASLGVQDFSPHVQLAIARVQPFAQVEQSVAWLRAAGIADINLDLMYGLPRQSVDDVRRSAELAAALAPQRLALFGYAHVPWFKRQQRLIDEAALPGLSERLAQAQAAADTLSAQGYEAIGLDHFARPDDELAVAARAGRLRRNFQGYTTDMADALIGIGTSAIGRLPQGYVQNAPDIAGYTRAIDTGRPATAKGIALGGDDRTRGAIIERLMCNLAVDLDDFAGANSGGFGDEVTALRDLEDAGVVEIEGSRLAVTGPGRPFVRLVAAAFDAYLPARQARHSLAV